MITSQIDFTNFKIKKKYPRIRAMLNKITKNKNEVKEAKIFVKKN